MFKPSHGRQKGRPLWDGFPFTTKSTTANSERNNIYYSLAVTQPWQRGSARWGHCDRLWLQTSLSNVAISQTSDMSQILLLLHCLIFPSQCRGPRSQHFSLSWTRNWHLVRKCLLCKWLKKQETSTFICVLQTFCEKEPSQQCESILNWMVCTCTTPCGAVCQPGRF